MANQAAKRQQRRTSGENLSQAPNRTSIGRPWRWRRPGSRPSGSTSTRNPERPPTGRGLQAVMGYAGDGDVIVAGTLDRLGRTVRDTARTTKLTANAASGPASC